MRRGVYAVIGTIAGTTLLVGAKLGTPAPPDPGAVAAADVPPTGGPSPDAPATTATAPGTPGPHPSAPRTSARPRTSRAPSAAPRTTAGTGMKDGTFTGAGASERYGTVTVTVTVAGGRMTNVSASYATNSSQSRQISNAAFPTLRQEALTAQSARIATVSGATYTSNAYKVSLQSALDNA